MHFTKRGRLFETCSIHHDYLHSVLLLSICSLNCLMDGTANERLIVSLIADIEFILFSHGAILRTVCYRPVKFHSYNYITRNCDTFDASVSVLQDTISQCFSFGLLRFLHDMVIDSVLAFLAVAFVFGDE